MLKELLNKITLTLTVAGALTMPLVPAVAFAQTKEDICRGVGLAGGTANCEEPTTGPSVNSTVKLVVSVLSFIVGVAAVIMIIVGGFKYITSGGDSSSTASAKNTILYALVGLIVAVLAQVLVRFVINQATTPVGEPESSLRLT